MTSPVEGIGMFPSFAIDNHRIQRLQVIMSISGESYTEIGLRMIDALITSATLNPDTLQAEAIKHL